MGAGIKKEKRCLYGIDWRPERLWIACLSTALILMAWAATVHAADELKAQEKRSGWNITLVPYIWALSETGSVTVKGQETDVNVTPDEMISKLNGPLMLDVDVRKGRFGGLINTFYAGVGDEESAQVLLENITFDTDIKMIMMNANVYYRLGPYGLGKASSKKGTRAVSVDPYIGARYTDMDVKLDVSITNRLTGNTASSSFQDRASWTDPIVGARTTWDLFRRWNVVLMGDIGGFGVGSDFAWSATLLGGYRFHFSRHIDGNVLFGYRALYQDYTEDSGSDRFEYDATMHGPIVGVAIGF